jgi:hypothetical protein
MVRVAFDADQIGPAINVLRAAVAAPGTAPAPDDPPASAMACDPGLTTWRIDLMQKIPIMLAPGRTYLKHRSRTSRPTTGEYSMRTMFLAAATMLALGVGTASAQGIGAGISAPTYGQKWAQTQLAERHNATAQRTSSEKSAREVPFWNFWSKRGS